MTPSLSSRLTTAVPDRARSAIISITGREGSGKTGFALTSCYLPQGKCVYIPMDRKPAGEYVEGLLDTKRILQPKTNFKHLLSGGKFSQDAAGKLWDELHGLIYDLISDKGVYSIVCDTGTYMWALIRMARFGKLAQVQPHNYGPVNSEMEALFYAAEEHGKVIIIIDKQSKEYTSSKDEKGHLKEAWTGRYERSGYSHLGFVANMALLCFKTDDNQFGVSVLQNKLKPEMDSEALIGDECQMPVLAWKTWGGSLEDYAQL